MRPLLVAAFAVLLVGGAQGAGSATSSRIAFGLERDDLSSIYTARPAARLLSDGLDISPAWSPDGKTIAFSRLADPSLPIEEATLYRADADGSQLRALGPEPVRGVSPAWSPDGRRIAFVSFADHNGPA